MPLAVRSRRAVVLVALVVVCLAGVATSAVSRGATRPAASLVPTAGPSRAAVGIADQKADMFADPRFGELGIRHVRRSVAWDALRHPTQAAELEIWLEAARQRGAAPLITFARSRTARLRHRPPGPAEFAAQFRRFHARFPAVRIFSAWNEANHCGEGTCRKPELVARYYRAIRLGCPRCAVVAADLVDQPNIVSWVRAFRRASKVEPRYWGLHNYVGVNRLDPARTLALLRAVRGDVWLTETGGLVARRNASPHSIPQGRTHAAAVTRYVFDRLARMSRRITRIYLYHWNSASPEDTWDSALIDSNGVARPAFAVLRRVLRERAAAAP